jgi:hypothetical protein
VVFKGATVGHALMQRLLGDGAAKLMSGIIVLAFLLVQCLDGAFTYLGLRTWGPGLEANPLVRSAVSFGGIGLGVAGAKLVAVSLGIVLHLRHVHGVVAMLTLVYVTAAILPWTALFLLH